MLGIPHCKLTGLTPARYRNSRLSVFLEKRMAWDTIHHRKSAYISMMKEMTECAGGISSPEAQTNRVRLICRWSIAGRWMIAPPATLSSEYIHMAFCRVKHGGWVGNACIDRSASC